jgi:fructose-1,6-bisphosphatase I
MNSPAPATGQVSLNHHLYTVGKVPDQLRHLILDIARAAKYIHYAIRTTDTGLAGSKNQFGEEQVQLDVLSDRIIEQHLQESRLVASYISEERDEVIEHDPKAPYSVVYDPLDGSSLVEVNFAIGSIFGIYKGKELIGRSPRDQVAALYVLYGPRTILVYSTGNGVHEFILNDVGEYVLLREFLGVADAAKTFSPGTLEVTESNPAYKKLVTTWIDEKLKLRYSGCMVADCHHILSKGHGIFTNVGGGKYPDGKLRLVFECGPFAYLMEQAGGSASNGKVPILDVRIEAIDQRTPLIIGSKNEVMRSVKVLNS